MEAEPHADAAAWSAIARRSRRRSALPRRPVLGRGASRRSGAASSAAARYDIVKGFAVGRTIFEAPARDWLAGRDRRRARRRGAGGRLRRLVDAWRGARPAPAAPGGGVGAHGHDSPHRRPGAGPLPGRAVHRDRRGRGPLLRRRLGDLRARQRRRPRRGAGSGAATRCRPSAPTTSRRWPTPRSPSPRPARRRRAMACTTSIGPGALNMVTAAGVAHVNRLPVLLPAGRRVRRPRARSGAAAGGGLRRRHGHAPTTASGRSRATSTASQRPEQLIDCAAARAGDHARSGDLRAGDPRLLPGRAGRGGRLPGSACSSAASGASAARRPIRASSTTLAGALRAAKAPLIIAGGGVIYAGAEAALARVRRRRAASRSPRPRPGKGALPWDHPLALGAIGVTGTSAANARRGRGRPRDRRRHAAAGLHHRLARAVRQPGRRRSPRSTSRPSTPPSTARWPWSATPARRWRRCASALAGWRAPEALVAAARARRGAAWNADWASGHGGARGATPLPSDAQVIGAVWREARRGRGRGLRRRRPAGRAAQAVAAAAARRLPRGIRLLLHGLRDRRRARA